MHAAACTPLPPPRHCIAAAEDGTNRIAVTLEVPADTAEAVEGALADLGFYDGTPSGEFDEAARDALEAFRGMNNFENHDLDALEDALARGWTVAEGDGEEKRVFIDQTQTVFLEIFSERFFQIT